MIVTHSKLSGDQIVGWLQKMALSSFGVAWIFVSVLVVLGWNVKPSYETQTSSMKVSEGGFILESIGSGALALSPKEQLGWVSDMARELVLVGYNSRPDATLVDPMFLVRLKGASEELCVPSGKVIGLEEKEGKLVFSNEGNISASLITLGQEGILVEVGRRVGGSEEKSQFVLQVPKEQPCHEERFFSLFKGAQLLGKDRLLGLYGDDAFEELKGKLRLEFRSGSTGYVCFVGPGDVLVWKEGEWREGSQDEGVGYALAKVISLSPEGIRMRVWDPTGFHVQDFEYMLDATPSSEIIAGIDPLAIHLRTASQVSFVFAKKRLTVRPGDWLLKTVAGIRNLRSKAEIDGCLKLRQKGTLLVVDSLEKEGNRWVLRGHVFDPTRTEVMPVEFPVDVEKKKTTKKQKVRK